MPPLNRKKINKSLSRIVDNFDDDEDDPILGQSQDDRTEDKDLVHDLLDVDDEDDEDFSRKNDSGINR